jgi:hypothetical protein
MKLFLFSGWGVIVIYSGGLHGRLVAVSGFVFLNLGQFMNF